MMVAVRLPQGKLIGWLFQYNVNPRSLGIYAEKIYLGARCKIYCGQI